MSNEISIPTVSHEKFNKKGQPAKKDLKKLAPNGRWWLADDETLPAAIMTQVATIIKDDAGRIDGYNTFGKLYGTRVPSYWNGFSVGTTNKPAAGVRDRLTYNIIQSCVDTLTSRIAQNKPKPMFLTQAGDSKLQRKAKKLDQFCYGLYYQNDVYKMAPKSARDSYIFGEGIIHPYSDSGKIKFERVMPYELLTDYLESHSGPENTKSLFRPKNIDRTQLMEMFPEHEADIAILPNTSQYLNMRSTGDTVTVVEAWRLPVGKKSGRHCIVTDQFILEDDDYDDDFFPFAINRYCPNLYGFYAQGMAEQLVPTQVEINRTLISIQRSLYLGGTHKIFVKSGSKVIKSHFDNMIGTILEYAGDTMPQYIVPQLVQPEIYAHLNDMKQSGYQLSGVSQLSAASQKPMGIDSGKALRAMDNIEVQRFQTVAQAYEQQIGVDLARITISVAKKAYLENPKLSVNVPGKRFIEKIDWKDVDMSNDEFSLQVYPTSKLPNDPEGRLQTIQEMMQAGLMSPEVGKRLLDYPDIDAEENLANATSDYLHSILDKMVEDGEFTAPEPQDDLKKAQELALEYYAQGKLNKLGEDKLELLRNFMDQIKALTAPPMPMMPPCGPAGSAPMANPTAPPVSDLVPNINQAVPNT